MIYSDYATVKRCYAGGNVTIPSSVTVFGKNYPVKYIGVGAFSITLSDPVTSVYVPDSVVGIDSLSFSNLTSLKEVTGMKNVKRIGDTAFFFCTSLEKVNLPEGLTSIGESAFHECHSLNNITLPGTLETIGSSAFSNCVKLSSIEIPASVTSIGNMAFMMCTAFKSVTIPSNVKTLGTGAFAGCELEEVRIEEGLKSLDGTFSRGKVKTVYLPKSVTEIKGYAFENVETVYYNGTRTEFNRISVDTKSAALLNANIICTGDTQNVKTVQTPEISDPQTTQPSGSTNANPVTGDISVIAVSAVCVCSLGAAVMIAKKKRSDI